MCLARTRKLKIYCRIYDFVCTFFCTPKNYVHKGKVLQQAIHSLRPLNSSETAWKTFWVENLQRKGKFSLANSIELSTKLPAGLNLSTIVTKCWKHLTRLIYCWCASRKAEQTCPYFQLLFRKCFDFLCARKAKRLMETKQKVIKH